MSREEINKAYEQGLEDAWKAINTIYYMIVRERKEVFCVPNVCDIFAMPPQEVIAKLEAYEKGRRRLRWEM